MEKPQVGQKVWVIHPDRRGNLESPKETKVSKVGNKYFYVEGSYRNKFSIENGIEETSVGYRAKVCFNLQDFLDEREAQILTSTIRGFFGIYGSPKLSLEKLRQINQIITN